MPAKRTAVRLIDPRRANPFPYYDAEIRRLRSHLGALGTSGWRAKSHCAGWSVKDVVSHLSTDELYNEACLDGTLRDLPFAGSLDAWNERGVRERRRMTPRQVLAEWERRQQRVRRAWGRVGVTGKIETSVGPYPLRLQVWHLAREYAVHADDIRVPVPARQRAERLSWRTAFDIFAAREEGERLSVRVSGEALIVSARGRTETMDRETFIAYLHNRPQHLDDPAKRQILFRLGRRG